MSRYSSRTYPGDIPVVPPADVLPLAHLRLAAELLFLFSVGGAGYYLLEVLFRGHSHPSMAICGGICFVALYFFDARFSHAPLIARAAGGALIITSVEFVTGVIVNLILRLDVWDYSMYPFTVLGQVCLYFTILWFFLSIPVLTLCKLLRQRVFTRG